MSVTASPGTVLPPPPPPPPSAPSARIRPRPTARGYWIGAIVTAVAVIGAFLWAVVAFLQYQHQIDRFPRTAVPGVMTMQLSDTATQVLYYENARGTTTPALAALAVSVTDPSGSAVTVTPYAHDLRYDVTDQNGRVGRAVGEFHPNQPGAYVVRSSAGDGLTGTLAVGKDLVWEIAPQGIGAAGLFLLGGGAGVAILVVTAVRRSNARP